ncbi:MAG: HEPN domain-containing protein [Acidimicrobiales bacterium]
MSARSDARAHLRKAREFLDAAELNLANGHANAAASSAVTSGINAKDAICLALTGESRKSDDHTDAVGELRAAGPTMGPLAPTLGRLLRLKNRSQYQTADVSPADAAKAVSWAVTLLAAASGILAG